MSVWWWLLADKRLVAKTIESNYSSVARVPTFQGGLTVYMAAHLGTGQSCMVCEGVTPFLKRVAVKVVTDKRLLETEVSVLQRLMEFPHPNIITFYGHCEYKSDTGAGSYFMIISRCVMSLRDIVEKKVERKMGVCFFFCFFQSFFLQSFTAEQMTLFQKVRGNEVNLIHQIAVGVEYLHSKFDYTHRDLKPANILLDESGTCKLIDFGISKDLSFDALNNTTIGKGTEGWALITSGGPPGKEGDVFGLGLTASWLLTNGDNGFGKNRRENLEAWARGDYARAQIDMPLAELFVAQCVVLDPASRISAVQCVHHPLFWNASQKLSFLKTCYEQNQQKLGAQVPARPWTATLPPFLAQFATKFGRSVLEQLRFCRTLIEHGMQTGSQLNELLLANLPGIPLSPDIIARIIEASFPMLLCSLYVKVSSKELEYKL